MDFKIGYSPERINPGDKVHTLSNICKIVSGMDQESLQEIKKIYDLVIQAGTYPVDVYKRQDNRYLVGAVLTDEYEYEAQ